MWLQAEAAKWERALRLRGQEPEPDLECLKPAELEQVSAPWETKAQVAQEQSFAQAPKAKRFVVRPRRALERGPRVAKTRDLQVERLLTEPPPVQM